MDNKIDNNDNNRTIDLDIQLGLKFDLGSALISFNIDKPMNEVMIKDVYGLKATTLKTNVNQSES